MDIYRMNLSYLPAVTLTMTDHPVLFSVKLASSVNNRARKVNDSA
ncbi:hypothetical protein ACE2AK_15095 [Rahnella perminowiae]|nr:MULTISPECIES: hypothetical protein [Rahnella]MCR9002362.1 hypothetical protein [Rahnella perminowiae]MCX2943629.1 hypothetical protein [Rahnella perminowiae]